MYGSFQKRVARVKKARDKLKHSELAVAASNNIHMLMVSQAQLKRNVELKMAGDMDEVGVISAVPSHPSGVAEVCLCG